MTNSPSYEALILNRYEHNGETKWRRFKVGNLKPSQDGSSFNLYIPEGLAISGRLVIQERQANGQEGPQQEAQQ